MNDQLFMLIGAAVLGVLAVGRTVYRMFRGADARARKRLAAGSSTVADRALVTLTGTVRANDTLEAPLSGTACVAYVAWAAVGASDVTARRDAQLSTTKVIPFELVTAEGTVLVEAETAELALDPRPLVPRKLDREAKFLTDRQRDASRIRVWSFREITLVAGQSIRIQGMALVEQVPPDEGDHYRKTGQRVRLVAHEAHPLTIGHA